MEIFANRISPLINTYVTSGSSLNQRNMTLLTCKVDS